MNNLSIVIPAYKNDKALKDLLTWLSMSVEQFEIVVILDGYESEINFAEFKNLRVYKIKGDTKWNQPQAKNLGVHLAKNSWIYFIDIDLKPTLKSINWIINTSLHSNTIYFPSRFVQTTGKKIDDAKGSYLVHQYSHNIIFGFDERFCGHYGHDDSYYIWKHERLKLGKIKRNVGLECSVNMRYGTKLKRDTTRNILLMAQLQRKRSIEKTFNISEIDYEKKY